MKLEDMIIVPSKDKFRFLSLVSNDDFEFNQFGLDSVMLILKGTEQLGEETQFIKHILREYLAEGQFEYPRVQTEQFSNLAVEVIQKCNLKCKHCYLDDKKANERISLSTFKSLIDQAYDLGASQVSITGGEPFVDKSIFEKVQYARSKDMRVTINTNGVLIDETKAKRLKELRVALLTLTLNGDKQSHEYLYGKETYEPTLNAIKVLKENGLDVNLNFIAYKDNLSQYIPFKSEMKTQFGISKVDAFPVSFDGSARRNLDVMPSPQEKREYNLPDGCNQSYERGLTCGAGRTMLFVKSNGNVTPCSQLADTNVGNIYEYTLQELINKMEIKR